MSVIDVLTHWDPAAMTPAVLVGYMAGTLTTIAFVPQAIKRRAALEIDR
mgnify:CR=1 FL=1